MKDITKKALKENFIQTVEIVLFITIMTRLFGQQEALTSVAGIASILMFHHLPLPTSFSKGIWFSSLGFFIFGSIASLNLIIHSPFFFIVNALSICSLMLLFGTPFEYKLYMPFILVYIFGATTEGSDFHLTTRLISLGTSALCIGIIYYFSHKKKEDSDKPLFKKSNVSPNLLKASLVMSLGISSTLLISQWLGLPRSMWICMTIMSLTQIDSSVSKLRFKRRLIGSLVGTFVYVFIFLVLVPTQFHFIIVLSTAYVYSFIEDYVIQIIFITLNALYAANVIWPIEQAIGMRVVFVLIGSLIVGGLGLLVSYVLSKRTVFKNKKSVANN